MSADTNTARAVVIADAILATDTDDRGNLFAQVAAHLTNNAQGYTGTLFFRMAAEYGRKDSICAA